MTNYAAIWAEADVAGLSAARACQTTPMVVVSLTDPRQPHEYVPDGPCGFAWVTVPGNTSFGRWAKKHGLMTKAYPKGLMHWVRVGQQSIQIKEAYARAFATILNEHGIPATWNSRLD